MGMPVSRLAIITALAQQVIVVIVMKLSFVHLPEWSREKILVLLARLPALTDLSDPSNSIRAQMLIPPDLALAFQDGWILLWFSFCNLSAFCVALCFCRLWSFQPDTLNWIVGAGAFVVSPIPAVIWGGTWHGLVSGYAIIVAGQSLGWWCWSGTQVPVGRLSDVRTVWSPSEKQKSFDPQRFMIVRRGVFLGLDELGKPIYLTVGQARQHGQVIGQTRSGKNVAVATLLAQFVQMGECVIIIDPKNDFFMPAVMAATAGRVGMPFTFLDIRPDQPPQLNLLAGCAPQDIEEMLIQVFDLIERGDNADVYRIEDRAAARLVAASRARSFPELFEKASQILDVSKTRKFFEALKELASLPAIQTTAGIDLTEVVGRPGIVYVVGSTRHEPTIRLQKMVLLRVLQIIDKKGQEAEGGWTALFMDEFKYLLSPAALQACGVIADRRCHLLLAHQSLGDLRDTSLPAPAVEGAVLVNCGLKLFFRTNDPNTATWEARLSGTVPIYTELAQKKIFKFAKAEGSWRESMRPLFDENVLQSLPPLHAILVGAGVPKKIRVGYLPIGERPHPVPAPMQTLKCAELI